MSVVVLLGVAMVATWTWALWPRPQGATPDDPRSRPIATSDDSRTDPDEPARYPVVEPLPRVESTEGLLVAQLFRGELTGVQYQRAMECLAARDAARHPVTIPGEGA